MLRTLLILIICSFIFCGCTSKKEKEIITFSSWGSITEVEILNKIITAFEKENPSIKINFIHIPQNYFQKIHLLFASNTAPDIIFINNLNLPIFEKYLEDLTPNINKKKFYEQSIDALSYKKKLLAIPRDISNLVLYVNKDLVSLPDKNLSLDTLLKQLLELQKQNILGINFEEDILWTQYYLAYYGETFDENFNPNLSKGFQFYKNLRDNYEVAPTKAQIGSSTLAQMFLNKEIAVYLSGHWMFPKIKEKATFNWEIVPFPLGENQYPCDASGWAISKNSKHKTAALKFINYLSNKQSIQYFTKTGLIVPARKDLSYLINNNQHNEKAFLNTLENSKPTYTFKNYRKLADELKKEF